MAGPVRDVLCYLQCSADFLLPNPGAIMVVRQSSQIVLRCLCFCSQMLGRNTAAVAALCEVGARVTPEAGRGGLEHISVEVWAIGGIFQTSRCWRNSRVSRWSGSAAKWKGGQA